MENFTARQIAVFVIALSIAGAITAWGTRLVLERYVLYDSSDPLAKQGGLSPQQQIGIGKK